MSSSPQSQSCTETPTRSRKDVVLSRAALIPELAPSLQKGDMGRIAVVGGSFEYTGAPFYAAMSALRTGADLAFILCSRDAAIPLKSLSPELIVYPILPHSTDGKEKLDLEATLQILSRVHVIIIGPGLSRDKCMQDSAMMIIEEAQKLGLEIIIDGDAIGMVAANPQIIRTGKKITMTPNSREYANLCKSSQIDCMKVDAIRKLSAKFNDALIVHKSELDLVADSKQVLQCNEPGSPRRCGGQGDIFTGILATFMHWRSVKSGHAEERSQELSRLEVACSASIILRLASREAFKKHGRGTISTEIIAQVAPCLEAIVDEEN